MASQLAEDQTTAVPVPVIVVTEPSPMVQNTGVSITEKAMPAPEQTIEPKEAVHSEAATIDKQNYEQSSSGSEVEVLSDEFAQAESCPECVVPVPEAPESQAVIPASSAESSEADQDDFRTSMGTFRESWLSCLACYESFCDRIDHRWRIPLWLIILVFPLAAGVMGSLYMFSCPAANSLPHAVFITGIGGVALVAARLCSICHRITGNEEGETKQMCRTLLLIATFVFLLFFSLESMIYWKVDWTSRPGADKFCDPALMDFMFIWNIVMYVALIPIIFFPA